MKIPYLRKTPPSNHRRIDVIAVEVPELTQAQERDRTHLERQTSSLVFYFVAIEDKLSTKDNLSSG